MTSHLENLNDPQRRAVIHRDGPILVLAGAGSGKTRVLTRRVIHLVLEHRVNPGSILAVTFTNKATEEMRSRLSQHLGPDAQRLWVATFHSAALKILRRFAHALSYTNSFVVYDEDDSKGVMKRLIKEMNIDEKRFPPSFFLKGIDNAKNNFLNPEQLAKQQKGYETSLLADVYDRYQKALFAANAMDFGDLLFNCLRLLIEHPSIARQYQQGLEYILVDEFQDTNIVQYRILSILSQLRKNIFAVGDDDQSIYGFRGATIENILNFERDFPETVVVKLEQNYRSTANILAAAHAVIEKNNNRKDKKLWCDGPEGEAIKTYLAPDETDEAYFVAKEIQLQRERGVKLREMAIFYRTNAQSRALEDILMAMKIPYRIFGALRFYDRKEIKDILAYLKLLLNERDSQSFLRIVNTPPRGVGEQAVQNVMTLAHGENLTYLDAARRLAPKQKGLAAFVKLYAELGETLEKGRVSTLVSQVIDGSNYRRRLKDMKDQTALSRLENLQELEGLMRGLEVEEMSAREILTEFLDRVSLTSSAELVVEEHHDREQGRKEEPQYVSLMTLHLAKGLEFPVVFFTGLEEGLLPHYRSASDPTQVEEERRLCYVGITRAMRELYITRSRKRGMFSDPGAPLFREPSRFVFDIPKQLLSACGPDFISGGWELEFEDADEVEEIGFDEDEEFEFGSSFRRRKRAHGKKEFSLLTADQLIRKR